MESEVRFTLPGCHFEQPKLIQFCCVYASMYYLSTLHYIFLQEEIGVFNVLILFSFFPSTGVNILEQIAF